MTAFLGPLTGYLASILLAVSLLVNNDLKFRWLNSLGCIAFIVYGIIIHAFPIILTNTGLLLINIYYLFKIYRTNENFDLVEFDADNRLIHKFLEFHGKDIQAYFPGYHIQPAQVKFVILRDMVIANIFAATIMEDGTALVELNYTVPKYRDYKVGKFLFQKEKQYLLKHGIVRLVYTKVSNKQHATYLFKMGFKQQLLGGQEYLFKNVE